MIRFAAGSDHPRLKALWAEAFGDPPEAIDAYFALRHRDENMLVDVRNGDIAGMLSMLPVTLYTGDGRTFAARYLYAIATDARYRRQGISTTLLNAAHTHIQQLGEAAGILVPATPALFDFYAKRGYTTGFLLDVITVNADDLPPLPPKAESHTCSPKEYTRIRDHAFQNSCLYVRWEEPDVAYAVQTFAQPCAIIALTWDSGQGCAAWEQTDDSVLVRELALTDGDLYAALSVLHSQLHAGKYTVRLAQGTVPGAPPQPFGMIRWLTPEPEITGTTPYLSLAMD